jgi:hypothetical protein
MDRGNAEAARHHPILQPAALIPIPHPPPRCPAVSLDLLEPSVLAIGQQIPRPSDRDGKRRWPEGWRRKGACASCDNLRSQGFRLQRPPALLRRFRGDEAAPSFLNGALNESDNDDGQGCTGACAIIPRLAAQSGAPPVSPPALPPCNQSAALRFISVRRPLRPSRWYGRTGTCTSPYGWRVSGDLVWRPPRRLWPVHAASAQTDFHRLRQAPPAAWPAKAPLLDAAGWRRPGLAAAHPLRPSSDSSLLCADRCQTLLPLLSRPFLKASSPLAVLDAAADRAQAAAQPRARLEAPQARCSGARRGPPGGWMRVSVAGVQTRPRPFIPVRGVAQSQVHWWARNSRSFTSYEPGRPSSGAQAWDPSRARLPRPRGGHAARSRA